MKDSKHIFTPDARRDTGFDYFMDGHAMRRQVQISLGVIVLLAAAVAAVGLNLRSEWPMRRSFATLVPHVAFMAGSKVYPLSRT